MEVRYAQTCLPSDEVRRIVERHATLLDKRVRKRHVVRCLGVNIMYDVRDDNYTVTLTLRINGAEICGRAESTMRLPALLLAFSALSRKVDQYLSDEQIPVSIGHSRDHHVERCV